MPVSGVQTEIETPPKQWGELLVLPENRSAVRAAARIARTLERPAGRTSSGNPLVFHGPPGVGKTAILQELVRRVIATAEARTARVLSATEFPRASSEETGDELADLRTCDLVAVEDLHHLKAPDLDAVCALLDHRSARGKPTVVTAPNGPANLTELPRRLTSRLGSGLVVRIDPPGTASRVKLARWYADKRKVKLDPDALTWLAETATGVRPLFGMVEELRGVGKSSAKPLTFAQVRDLLQTPTSDHSPLERIVAKVCETYRVKPRDLTGASRLRAVLVPRQVAMYLAREVARLPLVQIGRHFGGRDHTTVLNAVRKVSEALATDAKLATTVRELGRGMG
jgi:chromosomal replication initiator protein